MGFRASPIGAMLCLAAASGAPLAAEQESRANAIDVLLFDRAAWALMRAPEAPSRYEGLVPSVPADGLYLDDQGRGVYVVGAKLVNGPRDVLAALGAPGAEALARVGDPDAALERLGRVY